MIENKYESLYSEDSFWKKVADFAKTAGVKVIYAALLLYYVMKKKEVPLRVKGTILGALGYFISPIDAIADIVPGIGYTDDFGVLILALTVAAAYVDQEVKDKAKEKLQNWFISMDVRKAVEEVDNKIG